MARMIPLYSTSSQAEIEGRARGIFERADRPADRDIDHWLQAEADFLEHIRRHASWPAYAGPTPPVSPSV